MALNPTFTLFLIGLLLFAASNPQAHGQTITIDGLSVSGQFCCTSTGNCPGKGAAGVVVSMNCSILGATTTVGKATTDVNGSFNITVSGLTGLILGLPTVPCVATVQLPLDSVVCSMLSTTNGMLESAIRSVGTIISTTMGLTQNATLEGFVNVGH